MQDSSKAMQRGREIRDARRREMLFSLPYFLVTNECSSTCKGLRAARNKALAHAVAHNSTQTVVIVDKHSWFNCKASVYLDSYLERNEDGDIIGVSPSSDTWSPGVTTPTKVELALSDGMIVREYFDLFDRE